MDIFEIGLVLPPKAVRLLVKRILGVSVKDWDELPYYVDALREFFPITPITKIEKFTGRISPLDKEIKTNWGLSREITNDRVYFAYAYSEDEDNIKSLTDKFKESFGKYYPSFPIKKNICYISGSFISVLD